MQGAGGRVQGSARAQGTGTKQGQPASKHRRRAYEQDRKLAWLDREHRQQRKADNETGQRGNVASPEDEQSIPSAHYPSPSPRSISASLQESYPRRTKQNGTEQNQSGVHEI